MPNPMTLNQMGEYADPTVPSPFCHIIPLPCPKRRLL
jgi:hypothetical protein